jgi:hypothetical protein
MGGLLYTRKLSVQDRSRNANALAKLQMWDLASPEEVIHSTPAQPEVTAKLLGRQKLRESVDWQRSVDRVHAQTVQSSASRRRVL